MLRRLTPTPLAAAQAAHRAGAFDLAEAGYRDVLGRDRHVMSALSGLGVLLVETGRPHEAIPPLSRWVQFAPDGDAWFTLGSARAASGDLTGAKAAWRTAIRIQPGHLGAWNNLGGLLQAEGAIAGAIDAFGSAAVLAPEIPAIAANLALVLMVHGFMDSASIWAIRAMNADPDNAQAAIIQARLCDGAQLDHCAGTLVRLADRFQPPDIAAGLWFAIAQMNDKRGDFADAARALIRAHDHARRSPISRASSPGRLMARIDLIEADFTKAGSQWRQNSVRDDQGHDLTFIVGFPRSGTTLIEQLLLKSGLFVTSNETSPLARVIAEMGDTDAAVMGKRYRSLIPPMAHGQRFVDKLPLNILHLPQIAAMFPAARIIMALRDPRDVLVSCWSQDFEWNDAMVHFHDLEQAARFYVRVMGLWQRFEPALGQNRILIRYEELVTNPERSLADLSRFLECQLARHIAPINRAIATPSRHRVRQPITTDAVGGWRNYAQYLEPVMDQLAPFLNALGYKDLA